MRPGSSTALLTNSAPLHQSSLKSGYRVCASGWEGGPDAEGFGAVHKFMMLCDGPVSLLSLPIDATLRTFALLDICDVFSVISTCRALRELGRVGLPPECEASACMAQNLIEPYEDTLVMKYAGMLNINRMLQRTMRG